MIWNQEREGEDVWVYMDVDLYPSSDMSLIEKDLNQLIQKTQII